MEYDQQAAYEAPRPPVPVLWLGLTGLFALCCCFFFVVSGAEAVLLAGGFSGGSGPVANAPTPAPVLGEVKFYLDQTAAGAPSGVAVTSVPTTTKTVYAYFTYKNMPKTGMTWSYVWQYNSGDLPGASKTGQRWTKEGSGTFFVRLSDDKGLKPGDYDLSILLNDEEAQTGSIHVGP
jgi:hypothetical protein